MKKDDPPVCVALELYQSNLWLPRNVEEAVTMVEVGCDDFYPQAFKDDVVEELLELKRERDERNARVAAQLAEERYRAANPYWNHPTFGTWG